MNTTVEALQNLYVESGGSLTDTYDNIAGGVSVSDYSVIPDVIDAISALKESGATSELPAVSEDDNGSILTVVDGAWDKAEASGGLPPVTGNDADKVLKVVRTGASTAEWQLGSVITTTSFTGTTDTNGVLDLSSNPQFASTFVLAANIAPNSSYRPTGKYSIGIGYKLSGVNYPVLTFAGDDTWANRNVTVSLQVL